MKNDRKDQQHLLKIQRHNADAERLFELAKKSRYPGFLSELAESFGMMMVKVEAGEFRLKQIIEELEEAKAKLKVDADGVKEC